MSILTAVQNVSEKVGVTQKANNLTDQLNLLNDTVGADHGINAEDALINFSRAVSEIEVTPKETTQDDEPAEP
jgi:hypothetical protein